MGENLNGMPGSGADDWSMAEVVRNLQRLAEQVDRGFARVDERFDSLSMVHSDVYLADRAADSERHKATVARIAVNEKAVEELRESSQWLWRTVAGAVIAAIVVAIVAAGGFPH